MIKIKNIRNEKPKYEWDVRVDRSSDLGNPFTMKGEADRGKVCDMYEKWLYDNLKEMPIRDELNRLYNIHRKFGKLNLYCWCYPKRCHAETIKKLLESKM